MFLMVSPRNNEKKLLANFTSVLNVTA